MGAETNDTITELLCLVEEGDLFQAVEAIHQQVNPEIAVALFTQLARRLYAEKKSVSKATAIAKAGIQYCLCCPDSANPAALRLRAKILAFNLAADTWPGWGDEGIKHCATDLDSGLDAARLNLRLARELDRGPLAESKAHWMLGAHLLARRQHEAALNEFALARALAEVANDRDNQELNAGYSALVATLQGSSAGQAQFAHIVEKFATTPNSDNARSYAHQLMKALEVFRARESVHHAA